LFIAIVTLRSSAIIMENKSDDVEKGVKSTVQTENESIEDDDDDDNINSGKIIPETTSRSSRCDGKRYVFDPTEGRFGRWIEKSMKDEITESRKESGEILDNRCTSWMTVCNGLKILFLCACVAALILSISLL